MLHCIFRGRGPKNISQKKYSVPLLVLLAVANVNKPIRERGPKNISQKIVKTQFYFRVLTPADPSAFIS